MHDAPRTNIAGGTYHVTNRGNHKAVIFKDKRCRRRFLQILTECLAIYRVKLVGGCLIPNHFHLIVVTPHANISDFMRGLESRYADYWNWRFGDVGHLFQGPFRDTLIEHDLQLFATFAYVFMNPVKAGISSCPEECVWSTYAASIRITECPEYLSLDWLDVLFPAVSRQLSVSRLQEVMRSDDPIAAYLLQSEFDDPLRRHQMRSYINDQLRAARLLQPAPSLAELRLLISDRNQFIHAARVDYGYKVAEIARALGMPRPSVSAIFWRVHRGQSQRLEALVTAAD